MRAKHCIDKCLAKKIGQKMNINFTVIDLGIFTEALNIELAMEIQEGVLNPNDNLTQRDLEGIGRVILSHLTTESKDKMGPTL